MRRLPLAIGAVVLMATAVVAVLPARAGYASPTNIGWSFRTPIPIARWRAGISTAPDGDIYVFGGETATGVTGEVERYDPTTDTWMQRKAMPTPRGAVLAVTGSNGRIYVIGGHPAGGDAGSVVEEYDPASDSWTTKANYPIRAMAPGGARGPDGTIYVIGGYPGCCFGYNNAVYAYDITTDTWSARASMPTPREAPGVTLATDNKIYAVGGNGTGPSPGQAVEAYDPATNTWTTRASLPINQSGLSLVAAPNSKLYAIGFDAGTVLEYDPATDSWTPTTPLNRPRTYLTAAVAANGRLYAIAGQERPSGNISNVTEQGVLGGQPDTTPPTITISNPIPGAGYVKNQLVNAAYTCQDEPGGSGLASCTGTVNATTVANGTPLPTSIPGSYTLTVNGTDQAGNSAQATRGYVVWASFSGPVDAAPTVNTVNAGAGIPLKFSLAGDHGLNIFDTGYPKSQAVSCQSLTGNPTDPIESTTSTPAGLKYDPATDQYSYVWKTDKAWAGTCRQLILKFAATVPDYAGGQVVFDFQFN
jgi:N-acetylneuraminic acid mutarotase